MGLSGEKTLTNHAYGHLLTESEANVSPALQTQRANIIRHHSRGFSGAEATKATSTKESVKSGGGSNAF